MGEKGNDVVAAGASGAQSVVSRITETTVSTATDLAGDTGDAVKAAVIGSAVARGTEALGDRVGSDDEMTVPTAPARTRRRARATDAEGRAVRPDAELRHRLGDTATNRSTHRRRARVPRPSRRGVRRLPIADRQGRRRRSTHRRRRPARTPLPGWLPRHRRRGRGRDRVGPGAVATRLHRRPPSRSRPLGPGSPRRADRNGRWRAGRRTSTWRSTPLGRAPSPGSSQTGTRRR